MMNNGKKPSNNFTRLLTDNSETVKINPLVEIFKSFFGKSKHTAPALFLAIGERAPVVNTEKLIQMGNELRNELKVLMGK